MKSITKLFCTCIFAIFALPTSARPDKDLTQYVNPLVGTESSYELSTGNTYPAIALPWGMN